MASLRTLRHLDDIYFHPILGSILWFAIVECWKERAEVALRVIWVYRRIISLGLSVMLIFGLYATWLQLQNDARWDPGSSAVGALFVDSFGIIVGAPFCTATIVPSVKGNLLITAAHCLGKVPVSDIVYAPFYHSGVRPFGTWRVTSQVFPPDWLPGGTPNSDFAFLTVNGDVQARAGAEWLGISSPVPASVTVEGYLLAGGMTVCTKKPTTIEVDSQPELKLTCSGFPNGSSGGPFLVGISKKSGLGTIVGVVGGYQQGGDSSDVEYSAPFGSSVISLYKTLASERS